MTAAVPTTPPPAWTFAGVRLHLNSEENSLLVMGEAQNNTGSTQEIIRITGTFYDGQAQVIADSDDTIDFKPFDIVPHGGRVPFRLTVEEIGDPANYTLEVQTEPSGDTPTQNFQFTDQSQFTEDEKYCLTATIRNPGAELNEYLVIAFILFDSQNNVINVSEAFEPNIADIAGGQSLDLEMCADPLGSAIDHHAWRGWGR